MATKGWSFGALVDALKQTAFTDSSVNAVAGQIPILDPNANLLLPSTAVAGGNGLIISGPSPDYRLSLGNIRDSTGAATPQNWFPASLNFKVGTDTADFGLIRSNGPVAWGYGIAQNGSAVYQYRKNSGRHKFVGTILSSRLSLGIASNDVTNDGTEQFYITPNGASSTNFGHTTHTWNLGASGTINAGIIDGGDINAGIRCQPTGGSWEDWTKLPAGVQVDLNGASASVIARATLWGNRHVASFTAAFTNNTSTARINAGGATLTMLDNDSDSTLSLGKGGFTAAGSITAGGYVRGGWGSSIMHPDGNIEGSIWGGYLRNWIGNNFCQAVRLWGRTVIRDSGGRVELPSGCVYVGMSGSNYNPEIWASYAQIQYLINNNWVNVTGN